jgi:hypothetical protein
LAGAHHRGGPPVVQWRERVERFHCRDEGSVDPSGGAICGPTMHDAVPDRVPRIGQAAQDVVDNPRGILVAG